MRAPLRLLSMAALGLAAIAAAPAEAHGKRDGWSRSQHGGYWVQPPPRWVPAQPRQWHQPPRAFGYYAPPPRVYYPPPRAFHPPPRVHHLPPRHHVPPPSVGFYFRF